MILSEVKTVLNNKNHLEFLLPDGSKVPPHFHITEIGLIKKHFIDCGGTIRLHQSISFQLWYDNDYEHRLTPLKLHSIIEQSEKLLNLPDVEVNVEYQGNTIETYELNYNGQQFELGVLQTDCLAKDKCGIPETKPRVSLQTTPVQQQCNPASGCC